jgi:hypothetical protein
MCYKTGEMKINLKNKNVIINYIFNGRYLDESKNIGHEIINFTQSNDKNYYGYLAPAGIIPKYRRKKNDTFTIIFVAKDNENKLCVIGMYIDATYNVVDKQSDLHHNITYGNKPVSISNIFEENQYEGKKDTYHVFASLKCKPENVLFSNKPVYLKNHDYLGRIDNQSQRRYLNEQQKTKLEEKLNEFEWEI